MSKLKRMVALGTTLATILWAVGVVIPVQATVISNGDLVKVATDPAVYLIQGSQRRVFPHANVYHSWGYPADFSTVKTVTASELNAYEEGNPVPFRDGSMFRGTATSFEGFEETAVFYVEDAKIRPIKSEEIYQALFDDPNWELVTWVPDDLLTKFAYPQGSMIDSSDTHPDGCLVKYEDSETIYLIDGGKKREITPEAISLNGLSNLKVFTIPETETYANGTKITGAEEALTTPGWSTVVSGLTIALASDSPEATNVPMTAQNIPYTKIKITNGNAAAKITAITVKRTGLGAAADFAKVGLYEGDIQLGSYKAISSSTDTATFNLSTPISLSANQIKYLTLKGNMNADTVGHINKLGVTAITTDATVSGLPIYGNEMTVVNIPIANVTVSKSSLASSEAKIGEDDVELAVFKLANDSIEDVEFRSIKLEQKGTARESDVSNLALYYSTEKQGDCTLVNDYLTCVLDTPYTIKKGEARTFKVKGNIDDGVDRTFNFNVEEDYDVSVIGKSYGYAAEITNSYTTGNELLITTGALAINIDGPVAADITQDQDDVVLANFEITSNGESAELRKLYVKFTITSDGSTAVDLDTSDERAKYLENVELRDVGTGSIYDGTYDSGNKYKFEPYVSLEKGVKKTFELRFDVPKKSVEVSDDVYVYYPKSTATYRVDITGDSTNLVVKGDTSGENIIDISPSSVKGNTMTVKTAALTVDKIDLANGQATIGADGVLLYKGTLEAQGEAIKVTSIKFEEGTDNYFDEDNVEHLYLYTVSGETETLIAEKTDSQFLGESQEFSGLNLIVNTGSANKVTFALRADIASTLDSTYNFLQVKIAEVEAETKVDGTSLATSAVINNGTAGRTVTLHTAGTLTIDFDVTDSAVNRDRYVLAGKETPWIGRIKLDAEYEDVEIIDLYLNSINTGVYDSVDKIMLYESDEATEPLAEVSWESDDASGNKDVAFEDLNYVVDDVGIDYLWVKASLKNIGTGAEDTADSGDNLKFDIASVKARGVETSTDITVTPGTTPTKKFTVVGARIASIENVMDNGTLVNGVSNTLAKYKITVDATDNTTSTSGVLDLVLKTIEVTFTGNVTASAITIEREDGVDGKTAFAATGTVDGGEDTITFTANTTDTTKTDYKIESGQSATFIVKGVISGASSSGSYAIESKLTGLDDTTPTWNDEVGGDYNGVRLNNNEVAGAKLTLSY